MSIFIGLMVGLFCSENFLNPQARQQKILSCPTKRNRIFLQINFLDAKLFEFFVKKYFCNQIYSKA
jgi:hypothetical protein